MIFLKIDPSNGEVTEQHHAPFDPIVGKGKTKEELEKIGVLVESLPDPILDETKIPQLHINQSSGELFYKYIDRPKSREELLQIELDSMRLAIDEIIFGGVM